MITKPRADRREPPQKLGALIEAVLDTPLGDTRNPDSAKHAYYDCAQCYADACFNYNMLSPGAELGGIEDSMSEIELEIYRALQDSRQTPLPPLRQAVRAYEDMSVNQHGVVPDMTCGDMLQLAFYTISQHARFSGNLIDNAENQLEDIAATDPIGLRPAHLRDELGLGDHIAVQQDRARIARNLGLLIDALEAVEYQDTGRTKLAALEALPPVTDNKATACYKGKTADEIPGMTRAIPLAELQGKKAIIAQADGIIAEAISFESNTLAARYDPADDTIGAVRARCLVAGLKDLQGKLKTVAQHIKGQGPSALGEGE